MTRRSAAIGDKRDAHERVLSFAERFKAFMGRPPAEVVVFAEDFAALDLESFRCMPFRVVRGPSVQEYRW